jgi:hypothetical protein
LLGFGIVDAIVPEPAGGAAADPDVAAVLLQAAVEKAFEELRAVKRDRLVEMRAERYRMIGRRYTAKSPLAAEKRSVGEERGKEPGDGGDHAGAAGR